VSSSRTAIPEFDRLFARYWDGSLVATELDRFERILATDEFARAQFRAWCSQALAAAESPLPVPGSSVPARRELSRRSVLAGFAGGSLLGIAGGWLGTRFFAPEVAQVPSKVARVVWVFGEVACHEIGRSLLARGDTISDMAQITTIGPRSSALIEFATGSMLCIAAESHVLIRPASGTVFVERGGIAATFSNEGCEHGLEVRSPLVDVVCRDRADMNLSTSLVATEVAVQSGSLDVSHGDRREALGLVGGELVSVDSTHRPSKQGIPLIPDRYAIDPAKGLPTGWLVGSVDAEAVRPAIVPELFFDRYLKKDCYEIRSQHAYTRGLVRLFPDSTIEIDYAAAETGRGQLVICVRSIPSTLRQTAMLCWNGDWQACRPGDWKTLRLKGSELLYSDEPPAFAPPWVGFFAIFNAFERDLGLRIAGVRVSRPGRTGSG